MRPALNRRRLVACLAGCVGAGRAWSAPAGLPTSARLLVAGPAGGRTDQWADLLAPPLARALQQAGEMARQNVGGADGVTGANQFEALAAPDGSTALLVPGVAAISWLVGDARVKFDAAGWVPVWGGNVSVALASRVPLAAGRRIRIAVGQIVGPELGALLALDLLGIEVAPVAVAPGSDPMLRPDIDAALLESAVLRARSGSRAAGCPLAFGFGAFTAAGEAVRDPALPELPTAQELVGRMRPDAPPLLVAGLRAISAAMQLDVALVLPQLSPAGAVAWWRRGCSGLAQSPDLLAEAARGGLRPASPAVAGAILSSMAADVPVLLGLRRWLSERAGWRPL